MQIQAIIFMVILWGSVIGLAVFCYIKMLRSGKPLDDENWPHDPVK